jgi:hypothetical protein
MQKLEPFKEVVMQSPEIKRLAEFLDGQRYWGDPTDSVYSITNCIIGTIDELKSEDFRNLYMYVKLLFEQGILMIDGGYSEYHGDYGQIDNVPEFYIIAADDKHKVAIPFPQTKSINYFDYEDMPF